MDEDCIIILHETHNEPRARGIESRVRAWYRIFGGIEVWTQVCHGTNSVSYRIVTTNPEAVRDRGKDLKRRIQDYLDGWNDGLDNACKRVQS
jgi:hypothetical protein